MIYDHLFKILIIGDSGVGKTALLECYTIGVFYPFGRATIGAG
jgi:GTPase SAR1 family protein